MFRGCVVHPCCRFMNVCLVLSPFFLCVYLQVQGPFVCLFVCLLEWNPENLYSIAGVPSGQALLGLPTDSITVHHLCAFLM